MGRLITDIELVPLLNSFNNIAVLSHYNPDADALGSSLGLYLALKRIGKKVECINESYVTSRYAFFPDIESIKHTLSSDSYDAIVVCDCGALKRIGDSLVRGLPKDAVLINIDHHNSNEMFGTYDFINENACSASELVFDLILAMKIEINPQIATCLLAGVYGDTGAFRYSSTGEKTFEIARHLVSVGADPYEVASNLYNIYSLGAVKVQSEALTKLHTYAEGRIGEAVVDKEMLSHNGASIDDLDNLAERIREIIGIEISAAIREDKDLWRISLRSSTPALDVSEVAAKFGGGGHKVAAAFRWRSDINELLPKLRLELEKLFHE